VKWSAHKIIWLVLLVSLVSLLIVPRLLVNYGMDGDAWRGARSALHLFETGVYHPSRSPGNPLFEYILAVVIPWGGHIGGNLFVFLGYLASVLVFALLTEGREHRLPIIALFALTPIILLNSVTTLDYLPGLALMLFAYLLIRRGRFILGGVILGLSLGFRLSNALFILPSLAYIILDKQGWRKGLTFLSLSLLSGLAFYIPVFAQKGFNMFIIPPSYEGLGSYLLRTGYNALMLFGPLPTVLTLVIVCLKGRKAVGLFIDNIRRRDPSFVLEVFTVLLFSLLFVLHSDDPAYLLPIIPFLYLLFSRWLSKRLLVFLSIIIVSFALFNLEVKGGESGRRSVTFQPDWGLVVKDYMNRNELELLRGGVGDFNLSDKAVILTGMGAILTFDNDSLQPASSDEIFGEQIDYHILESADIYKIKGRQVYLLYALPLEGVKLLQTRGYDLYLFSHFAPSVVMNVYKYNPYEVGIGMLEIFGDDAFYK